MGSATRYCMDFGLAGLSEQLQSDVRSGTPAYMSPEQLAGTEVTAKSDIYALGLVLYELFTGKRAFEAASLMELMQMQERAEPASISTVVQGSRARRRADHHALPGSVAVRASRQRAARSPLDWAATR